MVRKLIYALGVIFAFSLQPAYSADDSWAKQIGAGYGISGATEAAPTSAPRSERDYNAEYKAWRIKIRKHLLSVMPRSRCDNSDPCKVGQYLELAFDVDRMGRINNKEILKSSDSSSYDTAALGALNRANPLIPPPLPPDVESVHLEFKVERVARDPNGTSSDEDETP